jgi:hypothetical protein
MLLIYLNDYMNENHASPAAYLFFLKLFTFLQYPMLTFHYFHPFHPGVKIIERNKISFFKYLFRIFQVFDFFN